MKYYACRPKWKGLIGSSRYSLEDNMKVMLLKWGVELWNVMKCFRIGYEWKALVNTLFNLGVHENINYLDQVSDC
jgi:hypothetical protein